MCRIVEPHVTYRGERLGDDDLCGVDGLGRLKEKSGEICTFMMLHVVL